MTTRMVFRPALDVGVKTSRSPVSRHRQRNLQSRAVAGIAFELPAQSFHPLTHAAQSVTFDLLTALPIVVYFEMAIAVEPHQPQPAIRRVGVAHYIRHRLAQRKREHTLL